MAADDRDRDWRAAAALVERFRADFERLDAAPTPDAKLGLAVSGGGDSLALLLLAAAAWPGCVEAATVDHGLRAEAAAEAQAVAAICARIGVRHEVLAGHAAAAAGSLQMRARTIRYALLEDWCRRRGLATLATAHQCDDQAETVLMRAARGSGVGGLAGIPARRPLGESLLLVRPLLGWRRVELAGIVAAAGLRAAADASNHDERHDRTRARRLLEATPWMSAERLARVAGHARDADEAIGWTADRLWGERARLEDGAVRLDPAGIPRELRRRLLARAIGHVSAPAPKPRDDRIARLLDRLDAGLGGTVGAVVATPGPVWRIAPAPPRRTG